jgi:hypothetical protein
VWRDRDLGQIHDPKLVGTLKRQTRRQVFEDRAVVFAVGRHHVAATLLGLQVMLSHQAPQPRTVHHHALVTQSRTHPSVAIALELVTDCLRLNENVERDSPSVRIPG